MQASPAKDSTVTLPRAIVRRSAAIQARIDARQTESKTDPVDPNAPPATPSAQATTPSDPLAPPVSADPAADPRENDPAYWRQRFNVTAGVLKAERTARQADATETARKLTEMQEQIRSLQAAAPSAPDKLDVTKFFTPEQIEQFGEDQCEAMARASMKSAKEAAQAAIEAEVKPLREKQARTEAQTIEDRKTEFTDKLAELVPNYLEIDVADDWRTWLAQDDEATGFTRQEILDRHVGALNAAKTAKVFGDFLKTKAPRREPPVVGAGKGAGPSGDAPPPSSPAAAKAPTDVEVKDFYKRAALGKVKDAERTEFEARMKLRAGMQ